MKNREKYINIKRKILYLSKKIVNPMYNKIFNLDSPKQII